MTHYKIWDKKEDIHTPSGKMFTAEEWMEKFPIAKNPEVKIVCTQGFVNGGVFDVFQDMKQRYIDYGAIITDDMDDEQVLRTIEQFEKDSSNITEAQPDERIAAALEAQIVMAMPSTTSIEHKKDEGKPSPSLFRVKSNYDRGLWNQTIVYACVNAGMITDEEAKSIVGG